MLYADRPDHGRRVASVPTPGGGGLDEADRSEFVDHIARNAEAGDLIPDTGGVRKIRWQRRGMGKRGGVRVVYFYHNQQMPLFLLLVYAKSQRVDMTADEKKIVRAMAMTLKRSYGWKG